MSSISSARTKASVPTHFLAGLEFSFPRALSGAGKARSLDSHPATRNRGALRGPGLRLAQLVRDDTENGMLVREEVG
jgi:hypothetical protein